MMGMKIDKFVLNRAGVRDLLQNRSLGVITEFGQAVLGRAGNGYDMMVNIGSTRCRATIRAATNEAEKDNLDNNTLLKARGG